MPSSPPIRNRFARPTRLATAVTTALVALGFVLGSVPRAHAAADARESSATPVIEVVREGSATLEHEEAIARAAGRVGAAVELVRNTSAPRLDDNRFARVTLRADSTSIEVELLFASGTRAVRRVGRSASPAVEGEELALVVESALESELEATKERRPPTPPPMPPPPAPTTPPVARTAEPPKNPEAPKPSPSSSSPTSLTLFAGTFAGVGAYGDGAGPVVRLGGELGVAATSRFRPALAMRASYTLPFDSGDPRALADASVINLRALPTVQVIELSRASFGLGLGVGADILSVSARSNVPNAVTQPVSVRADAVLSPTVMFRIGLARNVALSASVALDVGLSSRVWVAEENGNRFAVFAPFRVRPIGLVGLDFAAFGDDRIGNTREVSP